MNRAMISLAGVGAVAMTLSTAGAGRLPVVKTGAATPIAYVDGTATTADKMPHMTTPICPTFWATAAFAASVFAAHVWHPHSFLPVAQNTGLSDKSFDY